VGLPEMTSPASGETDLKPAGAARRRSDSQGRGARPPHLGRRTTSLVHVTPRVTLFPNYLHCKLNQASSVMVNQVIEVQDQNSKSGV
jgi:hypothetical protein